MYRRKLALDEYIPTLTAVTLFYSRIILKKLRTENKTTFRKLEKSVKFSVKCDADIKFIYIFLVILLTQGSTIATNLANNHPLYRYPATNTKIIEKVKIK